MNKIMIALVAALTLTTGIIAAEIVQDETSIDIPIVDETETADAGLASCYSYKSGSRSAVAACSYTAWWSFVRRVKVEVTCRYYVNSTGYHFYSKSGYWTYSALPHASAVTCRSGETVVAHRHITRTW